MLIINDLWRAPRRKCLIANDLRKSRSYIVPTCDLYFIALYYYDTRGLCKNLVDLFSCNLVDCVLPCRYMIKKTKFKKGDVLLSRDNKVFQFIQATKHPELGTIAMVRPYLTNRKVGIRFEDVKLHPLFA